MLTRCSSPQDKLSYGELRGHNPSVEAKRATVSAKGTSKATR